MKKHNLIFLLFAALFFLQPFVFAENFPTEGTVARVIDGDTVVLDSGTHIRFLGINAPEYEPWKNYTEPYGKEAMIFLKKTLTGKKVLLEPDVETQDHYGRTLAYVYLTDHTFINETLVLGGYAKARYYAPNGKYYTMLKAAEKSARDQKKGLWKKILQDKKTHSLVESFAQKV